MQNLKDVFHKDTYRFGALPDSYWASSASAPDYPALSGDEDAEVAIIGGGITGLVAGLHLAREFGKSVAVLDAGPIGWGASGRAGGFNSGMASKLSLEELCAKYGRDAAIEFAACQDRATELVYQLAGSEGIDIDAAGDGVFVAATSERSAIALQDQPRIYREIAGKRAVFLDKSAFQNRVHNSDFVWGGLHIPGGGGIHPLKYTAGLARAAQKGGARIYANSRVLQWRKVGDQHILHTAQGSLSARRVIVATNGYTSDNLHAGLNRRVLPVISSVLVTRPLEDAELKAAGYHDQTPVYTSNNKLFYYRLLPDNRFMIGGRGDAIGSRRAQIRKERWLDAQFHAMFPTWRNVEITHRWNGLVCVTRRGVPALGCMAEDASVGFALGCHGSGLNNATWMGAEQARIMASDQPAEAAKSLPRVVQMLPPRILGPRRSIIGAAITTYSAVDAWNNRPIRKKPPKPAEA